MRGLSIRILGSVNTHLRAAYLRAAHLRATHLRATHTILSNLVISSINNFIFKKILRSSNCNSVCGARLYELS